MFCLAISIPAQRSIIHSQAFLNPNVDWNLWLFWSIFRNSNLSTWSTLSFFIVTFWREATEPNSIFFSFFFLKLQTAVWRRAQQLIRTLPQKRSEVNTTWHFPITHTFFAMKKSLANSASVVSRTHWLEKNAWKKDAIDKSALLLLFSILPKTKLNLFPNFY